MKRLRVVAVIFLAALTVLFLAFPTYTHRYRLTIEIQTPKGVRTGSGVMQSSRGDFGYLPLPGRRFNIDFKGDAIPIDLGVGKNVFVTLAFGARGDDSNQIEVVALKAWGLDLGTPGWRSVNSRQGKIALTRDLIPTIVAFNDVSDPKSLEIVYATALLETNDGRTGPSRRPHVAIDRFAEFFGEGTSFGSAQLEVTDDPITRGIESKLRWLPHPQYFRGFACAPAAPHCFHGGDFKR